MAKFSLKIDPTFKAKVGLHVPGQGEVQVQFEFKGRTRTELAAFLKDVSDGAADMLDLVKDEEDRVKAATMQMEHDAKAIMEIAVGWELDDDFNQESIIRLLQKCPDAGNAIFKRYVDEMTPARLGN